MQDTIKAQSGAMREINMIGGYIAAGQRQV
jgi:hypothetical protein